MIRNEIDKRMTKTQKKNNSVKSAKHRARKMRERNNNNLII